MNKIANYLSELLYQPICSFCLYEYSCTKQVLDQAYCNNCLGQFLNNNIELILEQRKECPNVEYIYRLLPYTIGHNQDLIHNLKWNDSSLAQPLGALIADLYKQLVNKSQRFSNTILINIPSNITSKRNWSPSHELAYYIANNLSIQFVDGVYTKSSGSQYESLFSLSKRDRYQLQANQIYSLNPVISKQILKYIKQASHIIIVDDLIASGLSLHSCTQLIKSINSDCCITGLMLASSQYNNLDF